MDLLSIDVSESGQLLLWETVAQVVALHRATSKALYCLANQSVRDK